MTGIADILGPRGLLAQRIDGYQFRRQQLEMAEAVGLALEQGGLLISEAGTGTGKTFAYLVPLLLWGGKAIVSTGTKNLQDQLFHRDLPLVRQVLGLPVAVALLKGRANYLCRHRLHLAAGTGRRHPAQEDALEKIRRWAATTQSGDIAELPAVEESSPLWPLVTSTSDNCLGQECPEYGDCHLVEARRRAQEAELVIVNHHLLCADFALKEEGFGDLLPGADAFVLDEAHQLPEIAGDFFGLSVSSRQLLDLMRDAEIEYHRESGDMPELPDRVQVVGKTVRDLRLTLGVDPRRGAWREITGAAEVADALSRLRRALDALEEALDAVSGRGKGLDQCRERCAQLSARLSRLCDEESSDQIRWFETQRQGFRLNSTPISISDVFRKQMQRFPGAWVFTSATLAVAESFEHFSHRLGLEGAVCGRWSSPFDYARQAMLFIPDGLPDPGAPDYTRRVCDLALEVLEASAGRAFLLFTSHRALREAAAYLEGRLPYPLLVQGMAPRSELLERFRALGNGVLLGSSSFWEGVDVRGSALSCVIIDKLPFASPGDPVLQARLDALRAQGVNPFMEYQLPQAVIALKQGSGRLIRDVEDRGVLAVCDPRLLSRAYGRIFLASLPPMSRTRSMDHVRRFFQEGRSVDSRPPKVIQSTSK